MNKSLYNIEQEYITLATQIIECGGEISEEIEHKLIINEQEKEKKFIGYSKVLKQNKADINTIDEEIKRLQAEKKKRLNLESRLKTALTNAMNTFELDKFETPICKISFRKSESVEIIDESLIPDNYIKIERKVQKTELKKALKISDVEGVKLVVSRNIQVK